MSTITSGTMAAEIPTLAARSTIKALENRAREKTAAAAISIQKADDSLPIASREIGFVR